MLYSLADNAVKFTFVGSVKIEVDHDGRALAFRVIDTGIGIHEDDLGHLFEDFFQADARLTRRFGGTGIGLSICRQLAGLMGGSVSAKSKPCNGSTFTLTLPLERIEAPKAAPEAVYAPQPVSQASDLRVLAAEDNATNRVVLRTLLAPAGIVPTIAENGREAVEAWKHGEWDIVLMDIQMPEMNGVEATVAIRQRELETGRARTPIIAVTANAMAHQIAEYHAAGMDDVVPKPIEMGQLFEAIETALAAADEAQQTALAS